MIVWQGLIVVSSSTICYIDGSSAVQCVEIQFTQMTSFARLNSEGSRYILGDHRGVLISLALCSLSNPTQSQSQSQSASGLSSSSSSSPVKVSSLSIDFIGISSIPETLSYLGNGLLFIGSVFGDSQLVRLLPHRQSNSASNNGDGNGNRADGYLEVIETYENIGPIVDMCLVENDKGGGQRQLVTCSGAYKDGSLRIIRGGISLQEQVRHLNASGTINKMPCCCSYYYLDSLTSINQILSYYCMKNL